ncbi:MAG TPA: TcpE family conjugal transfer membrane protein [Streptosporangiaceae bacterium]|nr:TcpE family conjugal transfer membrane protein [Streptosporangiaceae bacterium]
MDLPTYTNIWRIEKRLYKLYDLRLPMPLPLVQIGVFLGVFVPWIVLLRLLGIPFGGGWILPLYLVPPAVLTWLATRPVIEGKRLTELLLSQGRYVTEPRTWCRLTPIREPEEVVVVARVWRRAGAPAPAGAAERAVVRGRRKARKAHRARHASPRPAFSPALLPRQPAPALPPRELPTPAAAVAPPEPQQAAPQAPPPSPPPPPDERQRVRVRAQEPGGLVVPRDPLTNPSEPPPAVPQLDMPSVAARAPAPPDAASGKRGLVSGVLRAGDVAADSWQAISKTDAEHLDERARGNAPAAEPATPATGAETGDSAAPPHVSAAPEAETAWTEASSAPAPERARESAAPGAAHVEHEGAVAEIGAAAEPRNLTAASDAESTADAESPSVPAAATDPVGRGSESAAESATESARAEAESTAAEDTGAAEAEETAGAGSQRAAAQAPSAPVRNAPRPWSEELSRPREARTDSLVWPPPPHRRPGAEADRPGAAAAPPASAGKPVWGRPTGPVRIPAAGAGTPSIGAASRPEGTPVKPPPPRVVPDAHELPAPPRETRSGPASPVRPEPRHRGQRPAQPVPTFAPPEGRAAPSAPAITPPDPAHDAGPVGLRRLLKAVGGGHTEMDSEYEERLQRPFYGARHIVVLGCTGGAGQTVTALMMGHTFAQHCGEPVVAIDVNPGPGALTRRTRSQTPETLTGLITRADQITSLTAVRRYTSRAKSGLDVIAAGKNPVQALDDRDYALAFRTLDHFYSVTMLDVAAAIVARVLPYADQLVLVAPASADAARAVQMTFEWLDGHGYDELRARAVTVVNGVSRRSMGDVSHAESVARGRCRALVRIPWDDHLSLDRSPRNELKSLRAPTRRAYLALAGVVAGGFSVVPDRYQEQEATR